MMANLLCWFVYLIYFIVFISLSFFIGYQQTAVILNVPVMSLAFSDLHVVVVGYEKVVSGGNLYLSNEFDPWSRLYNYPKGWLVRGYLGLDHKNLFFWVC